MRNVLFSFVASVSLLCVLSCSGGGGGGGNKPGTGTSNNATSLGYTNPTDTGAYRFVRGAASTGGTLVLELMGPAGVTGRGVTFALQSDSKARFVKVNSSDAEMAQNGGVFQLGTPPHLFKAVTDGNALRVSVAQKGAGNARSLDGVLARVALQLQSGASKGSVSLNASNATFLPASGEPTPITIAVGALVAQ